MAEWAIPQQAKLKYTQLFNSNDRNRTGFLSGLQCRDILMQSGLPRNVLADIWNLSDIDSDGQLSREEFILALHLTNHVRSGKPLPSELPSELVPPSYRRTSSVSSSSSIQPAVSSSAPVPIPTDDARQQQQPGINKAPLAASVLTTNSFEDKRRENFEKGRAELERRRLKVIEQQTEVLKEQLENSKKSVAEAKSKIDIMRTERDAKMGLLTSLEAQIQAIRDKDAYLMQEEQSLIAIAKDLKLVNSDSQIELNKVAEQARLQGIESMKKQIQDCSREKETMQKELESSAARVSKFKVELKELGQTAEKLFDNYKKRIEESKLLREQFASQNKAQIENLGAVWDSLPPFDSTNDSKKPHVNPNDDPWLSTTQQQSGSSKNEAIATFDNQPSFFDAFESTSDINSTDLTSKYASLSLNDSTSKQSTSIEQNIPRKLYKVLYAFEARNLDELTINPGDIITGINIQQEPGWLSGELHGRSGLFPQAFVEPYTDQVHQEEQKVQNLSKNDSSFHLSTSSNPPHAIKVEAKPQENNLQKEKKQPIIRYKAIYAFEARNPDELNLNPGDVVIGSNIPQEPGWLSGDLNGKIGLFPEAYVEKLAEEVTTNEELSQNVGVSIQLLIYFSHSSMLQFHSILIKINQLLFLSNAFPVYNSTQTF